MALGLTKTQEIQIVRMFAHYKSDSEIAEFCKTRFKKPHTPHWLREKYVENPEWNGILSKFRDEYLKSVSAVPLFNKRVRLEELQKLYEASVSSGDMKEARAVLNQFHDEAEGKGGDVNYNFTQINHTEFNNMSNEELDAEYAKTLEQLKNVRRFKEIECSDVTEKESR